VTGWKEKEQVWWCVVLRYGGLAGLGWEMLVDHFQHPYSLPVFAAMMGLTITGFLPGGKE
jgi:hypothetical protein